MEEMDTLVFNLGTDSEVLSSDTEEVKRIEAEEAVRRTQMRSKTPVTIKLRKLSDRERKELERMMDHVAVHDYGDDDEYNLTDTEKATRQTYYKEFAKLRNVKRKINKIDEYVRAVRQCIKCLNLVATNNRTYQIGDFWEKVFNGEITVNGITFPTYIGKNKKTINWDYVREFIQDPNRDLKELLNTINGVVDEIDSDELIPNPEIEARLAEALEGHGKKIMVSGESKKGRKETREVIGEDLEDAIVTKDILDKKNRKSKRHLACGVGGYDDSDDFDEIEKEDHKRGIWHDKDRPKITGPIESIDDLDDRIDALDNYADKNGSVLYRDKYQSPYDARYAAVCDMLDEGGFNIRAFIDTRSEAERKLDKICKKEDKEHKKLKKRIEELDERRKARKAGKPLPEDSPDGKKSKKGKKKKKKAEKALMDATGVSSEYKTMNKYSDDMSDFDW